MGKNKERTKFFFIAFYLTAMVLVVFHAWNELNHKPLNASSKTALEQISDEVLIAEYDKAGEILAGLLLSDSYDACQGKIVPLTAPDPFIGPLRCHAPPFTFSLRFPQ